MNQTIEPIAFMDRGPECLRHRLDRDDVHVWFVRLPDTGFIDCAPLERILPVDEIRRSVRFERSIDRVRFLCAHAALRHLLGRYLDCGPEAIVLSNSSTGKPRVASRAGQPVRFNMSRSGGWAIYAFARNHELGVDIEQISMDGTDFEIAHRVFSHDERSIYAGLEPIARCHFFFRTWTLKESCLKGLGSGLSVSMTDFSVLTSAGVAPSVELDVPGRATREKFDLFEVSAPPNYRAALAVERSLPQARIMPCSDSSWLDEWWCRAG